MAKRESDVGEEAVVRQFEVSKAFEIELPQDRIFCTMKECADRFFRGEAEPYGDRIGCYVFSLRTGRGSKPYYVGMTVSSFKGEVFQYHKILDHYQQIVKRHKGTPTMTFVSLVDGSEPTQDSSLYKRFRVTERTTVKARAFDAGGAGRGSLKRVAPSYAQHGNTRTGDRCAPEASGRRYGVTRCEVGVTSF